MLHGAGSTHIRLFLVKKFENILYSMNQGPIRSWDCLMQKTPEVENLVTLSSRKESYTVILVDVATASILLFDILYACLN
jgi:hypothetical protein